MKYLWTTLLFVFICMSPNISNALTLVGSQSINMVVTIVAGSCSISSGSKSLNVDFKNVPNNTATAVGKVIKTVPFKISFSGCNEGIWGTQIAASGTSDPSNLDYLSLSNPKSASTAQGIAIKLSDLAGKTIGIGSYPSDLQRLYPGDNNVLELQLSYIVTKLPVVAGNANAVLYLDMYYQ